VNNIKNLRDKIYMVYEKLNP